MASTSPSCQLPSCAAPPRMHTASPPFSSPSLQGQVSTRGGGDGVYVRERVLCGALASAWQGRCPGLRTSMPNGWQQWEQQRRRRQACTLYTLPASPLRQASLDTTAVQSCWQCSAGDVDSLHLEAHNHFARQRLQAQHTAATCGAAVAPDHAGKGGAGKHQRGVPLIRPRLVHINCTQ